MTTLTDFLLARIAEDEASIDDMVRHGDDSWWSANRMLAECEAKRRIAEGPALGAMPDTDDWAQVAWDVVCLLAMPYADHPDYREEWRP